ncbi:hypothetical protein HYALB_00012546 [Hymenoscyphus albidus]|uniref:Uncharacterized protein n=1 Tax=Hymenoscyphus albidus TaxID=595503 RepID=A0A9N9LZE0_9HELO|nr:hypothetical protein HYALB_00012546 [Hymenoscyphus albidus]
MPKEPSLKKNDEIQAQLGLNAPQGLPKFLGILIISVKMANRDGGSGTKCRDSNNAGRGRH